MAAANDPYRSTSAAYAAVSEDSISDGGTPDRRSASPATAACSRSALASMALAYSS